MGLCRLTLNLFSASHPKVPSRGRKEYFDQLSSLIIQEMQLSWQPGFSLSRKPMRRSAPRRKRHQPFEFVVVEPRAASHFLQSDKSVVVTPASVPISESKDGVVEEHRSPTDTLASVNEQWLVGCAASQSLDTVAGPADSNLELSHVREELNLVHSPTFATATLQQMLDESILGLYPISDDSSHISAMGPCSSQKPVFIDTTFCLDVLPPAIEYDSPYERFKPVLHRCE